MMLPPIIDMRLRPPIPAWTRGSVFRTAMHYPRHFFTFKGARSAWLESVDILFEEMDSAGIRYGVLMGRASSGAGNLGGVANREIVEAVAGHRDRFLGFLGVDLDAIPESLAEIREYAREPNIKGISIEPGSAREPRWSDDPSLSPIYEIALEYGLPVSISLSGLLSALAGHDITWSRPVSNSARGTALSGTEIHRFACGVALCGRDGGSRAGLSQHLRVARSLRFDGGDDLR